eukprot:gene5721-6421_t
MGCFCSKINQIGPVCSNGEVRHDGHGVHSRRFCWCSSKKVAPVCSGSQPTANVNSSLFCVDGVASVGKIADKLDSTSNLDNQASSNRSLLKRNKSTCDRLAMFQAQKKPLPEIGAQSRGDGDSQPGCSGINEGRASSIAFAVDINGMTIANGSMRNTVLKPIALRQMPEIARFKIAADGRQSPALIKTSAPQKLSKEMLERMEVERQREIELRNRSKMIEAEARRQQLMEEKEQQLRKAERRRLRAKEKLTMQTQQLEDAAQNKMRKVEERKEEMRQIAQQKKELVNKRHEQVKQNIANQQREVVSAAEAKMRRVEERREELRMRQQQRKELCQQKQESAVQSASSQNTEVSSAAREKMESRMRQVEERKAALRRRAEERKEMLRNRRLRASLKSRLAKMDDPEWIAKHQKEIDDSESQAREEDARDSLQGIETAHSDSDSNNYDFNDGNRSDDSDESFWATA